MIRIARTLPGELVGKVNPEDYGFEVIKEEPPDKMESAQRVARLYRQIRKRTGVTLEATERYLLDVAGPELLNGANHVNGSNGNGAAPSTDASSP